MLAGSVPKERSLTNHHLLSPGSDGWRCKGERELAEMAGSLLNYSFLRTSGPQFLKSKGSGLPGGVE
jgi:hypothetical protein